MSYVAELISYELVWYVSAGDAMEYFKKTETIDKISYVTQLVSLSSRVVPIGS